MAAVRPEFRSGVLTFDPRDPVFGGPPCTVPGCERPARARNLCWGHRQRWLTAGKPDLAQFTASTSPDWAGTRPLPGCAVPGCGYCHCARGLCQLHHQQWGKAGRPGISGWAAALDYAPPSPPPDACAVPGDASGPLRGNGVGPTGTRTHTGTIEPIAGLAHLDLVRARRELHDEPLVTAAGPPLAVDQDLGVGESEVVLD